MNRLPLPLLALLLPLTAPFATAQQQKVVPMGMDVVEAPLVYTYPFGRATGAISLLYDADQITTQQGLVLGIRFRQSQVTAAQLYPSYTKNYQVTAYTVQAMAASMSPDPLVNAGSAVGTVVFNGPLTLPAVTAITTFPADFGIHIPFTTPYVYDGSQGNLMFVLETADTAAVPSGSYRIDAVNFANTTITGLVSTMEAQGCVVQGQYLTLGTVAASAIVGGSITQTLTSSSPGAFPAVMTGLSFSRLEQNLAAFGMPSCTSWMGPSVLLFVLESGGAYPNVVWTLPNDPSIEGVALAGQALGLAATGLLSDSVTSNGVGTRIGSSSFPVKRMGMSFRGTTSTWSQGTNGTFIAVAQLEGVFP